MDRVVFKVKVRNFEIIQVLLRAVFNFPFFVIESVDVNPDNTLTRIHHYLYYAVISIASYLSCHAHVVAMPAVALLTCIVIASYQVRVRLV